MSTPPPEPDAARIAAAVMGCRLVAGLHAGRFGEVATYLPGRRICGVRIDTDRIEVHVVGRYPATMDEIATEVRTATSRWAGPLPVHIHIEDLQLPQEPAAERLGV